MFVDMFDAMDAGREPMETFYDGYVVNAILDACYESNRTKSWAPVEIDGWRAGEPPAAIRVEAAEVDGRVVIKEERLPDGQVRRIYKDKRSGELGQEVVS
jgi:hypothetical protein